MYEVIVKKNKKILDKRWIKSEVDPEIGGLIILENDKDADGFTIAEVTKIKGQRVVVKLLRPAKDIKAHQFINQL